MGHGFKELRKVRQIRGRMGALFRNDFTIAKQEGPWHLQGVAGEVADSTAFENRHKRKPPYARTEQLEGASFSQSKSAVKIAAGIGDAGDIAMAAEVADFPAAFEHVDEHESRVMALCEILKFLQLAENLAGECAAEMPQKHQHQQVGCRGLRKSLASRQAEVGRRLTEIGTWRAIAGPGHFAAEPAFLLIAAKHQQHRTRLSLSRKILLGLAILACLLDYLARSNVYAQAFFPLPLPSGLSNAIHPHAPVVDRASAPRRPLIDELAWLAKHGDSFLLLTDPATAFTVPSFLPRFGKSFNPVEVLNANHPRITDEFAFESVWYNRCCFVVDSPERAQQIFDSFLELMEQRRLVRAKTRQTAHILWDLPHRPSSDQLAAFERLAKATGFSLMLCR